MLELDSDNEAASQRSPHDSMYQSVNRQWLVQQYDPAQQKSILKPVKYYESDQSIKKAYLVI